MTRDTLTRDQIVRAAIELLDDEGLEGLNMRALGKRLNSAATAVYWHVGSKSNLITLAADEVWTEIRLPDLGTVDWRTASMATDLYAMLTSHLWLVQAFGSFFVYGPGKARHDDHGLAIFEAAGFTGPQADQAYATVFTFILGNALGPSAEAALIRKLNQDGGDLLRDRLTSAKQIAAEYPHLRARLDTPAADYAANPQNTFAYGLQAILDGLESQLKTTT